MALSFRSVCSGTGMLANTALSQNLEEALFFKKTSLLTSVSPLVEGSLTHPF